jgi:hypothetical protein
MIQQHQDRVVDSPGDNLLAKFGSAVWCCRSERIGRKKFGRTGISEEAL